jgi:hypothetical protein
MMQAVMESPTENRRSTRQFPLRSGRNSKIAAATEATARNPKAENESGKSRRPADHSKQRFDQRRKGQLFGASWNDKYSRQIDERDSIDADVAASAAMTSAMPITTSCKDRNGVEENTGKKQR